MPRCTTLRYLAMLAVCVVVVAVGYAKGTHTMGTNNSTTTIATTTNARKLAGATTNKAVAALPAATGTTAAALQPAVNPVPLAPNAATLGNWVIAATGPSTAKQATNGVGPAGKAGTVPYVVVSHIAAGGATMASLQAAITALGLRGKHPALAALHWLAKNRGYSFACKQGVLSLGA